MHLALTVLATKLSYLFGCVQQPIWRLTSFKLSTVVVCMCMMQIADLVLCLQITTHLCWESNQPIWSLLVLIITTVSTCLHKLSFVQFLLQVAQTSTLAPAETCRTAGPCPLAGAGFCAPVAIRTGRLSTTDCIGHKLRRPCSVPRRMLQQVSRLAQLLL